MTNSQRKLLDDVRAMQVTLRSHHFDAETLDIMLASAQRKRNANPRNRQIMVTHMALKGLVNQMRGAA